MIILFVILLVTVPVFVGRAVLRLCYRKEQFPEVWESYIVGTFSCILLGEALHLCTLFLHWPFCRFALWYGIVLTAAFVLSAGAAVWEAAGKRKKRTNRVGKNRPGRNKPDVRMLVLAFIVILQCFFFIVMHMPDNRFDITAETVSTMLETDTVYQLNPMTGRAYEVGMPMRIKILALPSIYAAVCKWFHLEPQTVVYSLIPMFVLVLSYFTFFGWARFLYPALEKKQHRFMLFAALLLQFGNYAAVTLGYGLFHMGYRGEILCAGVLYPYLLLLCLRRRKLPLLICLAAEIGMVWTWYGLGGGLFLCLVTTAVLFLSDRWKRRRGTA